MDADDIAHFVTNLQEERDTLKMTVRDLKKALDETKQKLEDCQTELPVSHKRFAGSDFQFVSDTQDVEAIKRDFPAAAEFDSFFVKVADGDYQEVWGMLGIVLRLDKVLTKIL